MAVLAPPPDRPKRKKGAGVPIKTRPEEDDRHWTERLTRSGYFIGAVLLHLIIFLIVATWVVFKAPQPPADDFVKTYVAHAHPPPPPPMPHTVQVSTAVAPTPNAIVLHAPAPSFTVPLPTPNVVSTVMQNQVTFHMMKSSTNLGARLPGIMATVQGWGRDRQNIEDSEGDPKSVKATFPVYVASYADGDWGCNTSLDGDQIVAGSMPDLVTKINQWSHGNLKGHVEPNPLDIGGPDLMAKKPPFIFFTGHKDFVLTDTEIENLRAYLQVGGAIWGDNALPGRGSRFDIAFRREMKRVVPDKDKQFVPMDMSYPLFAKQGYYPFSKLPTGMNYYAEPIEHLDLDGKLAIIYTPNDYSDLFFMDILPGDATIVDWNKKPGSPLFSNYIFLRNANIFFRNFTLPSCLEAQHFGMNIVAYLLVRFDNDLILAP